MKIRKAAARDLDDIEQIYEAVHDLEESGKQQIGWARGVYPTRKTAEESLARGDLFVMEDRDTVAAAAVINQIQVPDYRYAKWEHEAKDDEVMVLHTLVVDPLLRGSGYGTAFVHYYEEYAAACGCRELRMDTNEKNRAARAMYAGLGYAEADVVPCEFNGIQGVRLVCLEKRISLD